MAQKKENQKQGKNYLQYIVPAFIIIGALVIFNPSMNNGFLLGWDDTEYLTHEDVQQFNAVKIFSDYHLGMYQPLAVISLALNYGSAGESPGAYHATNLFLHIINILLLWVFILKLTRKRLVAGIVAFLFAMHPMNVEPISWIAARSTLLFTAFYLGGMITYLRYRENKKLNYLIITAVLALAALFTKSLAMSFPFALILIDYYKDRQWNKKAIIEKIPFLLFSLVFGFVAINAAQAYGHISELQYEYSLIDRFFILSHTFTFYLAKLFAPVFLSSIYAFPEIANGSLPMPYYLSALVPLASLFILYRYRKKGNKFVAAFLFFCFAIAPVLPMFWSRIFVAADRYAYLSFIGLFLVLGLLAERMFESKLIKNSIFKYGIVFILAIYGAFMMFASNQQCKYWIDSDILMGRAVYLSKTGPEKALAHFYHGNVQQGIAENRYTQGQINADEEMIKNSFSYYIQAVDNYDSVIKYNPDYMMAYSNRGMIFGTLYTYDNKYWEMAKADFDKAISLNPGYADNYYNKGWLLFVNDMAEGACKNWFKADSLGSVVAMQAIEQNCK